jgi:non-homologous end joining protein Ku
MEEVKRASVTTTLQLGAVEAEVKLYKATGSEEKAPKFQTAGPHGGILRAEKRAVEVAVDETPVGADPLGFEEDDDPTVVPAAQPSVTIDPGADPERPPLEEGSSVGVAVGASAPGEFKTVMVEEGYEDEIVEPEQVRKGVRHDDGRFTDLTDQLAKIDEDSKLERLEVLDFIRRERVPRERIVSSYYLAAGDKGLPPKVLRVIYEAMRRAERVAIVRWTKRKGQSLGILAPHASGALVVMEVVFADAARKPNAACLAHMRAMVTEKQVERAVELVEGMNAPPSALDEYVDKRVALQRELFEKAEAGESLAEFSVVEKPASPIEELDELLAAAGR